MDVRGCSYLDESFANRFSSYPAYYIQGVVFGKYLRFSGISDPMSSGIHGMHQNIHAFAPEYVVEVERQRYILEHLS